MVVVVVGSMVVVLLLGSSIGMGSRWLVVGIEVGAGTEGVAVAEGRTDLALVSGGSKCGKCRLVGVVEEVRVQASRVIDLVGVAQVVA